METENALREPKQSRSIRMKQKILDTAYELFCKKGYFNTTTNEIAKAAKVSIGSVYFYFKDKDSILLEILRRYNESFTAVYNNGIQGLQPDFDNPSRWFSEFMECLIALHRKSVDFNRELQELRRSIPQVDEMFQRHNKNLRQEILDYMSRYREKVTVHDLEAAAIVTFNIVNSTVDQVVFCENDLDDERIIHAGAEAVCKYLME